MALATSSELVVYAPGLLGPYTGQADWQTTDWPDLPLLQKVLSRADRLKKDKAFTHNNSNLLTYFNLDIAYSDLPLAALSLLAEGRDPGDTCWMRLDPVCLHADRSDAILIAHDELVLTEIEADALQESIRHLLDEWSIRLLRTTAHHWYVCLPDNTALLTTPLAEVKGQAITTRMPRGQDYMQWHRLMNEVQMSWHSHPVNLEREQQGQYMATSVWPWGCGTLVEIPAVNIDTVYSDDVIVQGLAKWGRVECLPLLEVAKHHLQGQILMADFSWQQYQQQQNATGWFEALSRWQDSVLQFINERLEQDKSLTVSFDFGGDAIYRVNGKTTHRWWRRTRTLQQLILHAT